MKLIGTYRKSEVEWRNLPDRALPVCFMRRCVVEKYRPLDDSFFTWMGFRDKEIEYWGPWGEHYVDWSLN